VTAPGARDNPPRDGWRGREALTLPVDRGGSHRAYDWCHSPDGLGFGEHHGDITMSITLAKYVKKHRRKLEDYEHEYRRTRQGHARLFTSAGIASLTVGQFEEFLSSTRWRSLARNKRRITTRGGMKSLRACLTTLLHDSGKPLSVRLDLLRPADSPPPLPYFGKGVITAILHTVRPTRYGVWNATSEKVATALGILPKFERGSSFGHRYLIVNDVFADAAKSLGVTLSVLDSLWWDILSDWKRGTKIRSGLPSRGDEEYEEGVPQQHLRLERSRSNTLVRDAKRLWTSGGKTSPRCEVCLKSMEDTYGNLARGFIEAHHRTPFAQVRGPIMRRIKDLAPVCPNCHRMLHRRGGRSIRGLQELMTPGAGDNP